MLSDERLAEIKQLALLVPVAPALSVAEAETLIDAVPELLAEVERLRALLELERDE